ncbi:hypothetical protein [Rhizobium freirei]|uniref:hypothetical protein n=1 Tax=Rhizobium freirei TaxID=1353277 RepID=UPI0012F774E1|nr:hypothetical protein [Rhizobium freirei]
MAAEASRQQKDHGYGADPSKYEMSAWGARFTYDEAGELFYAADGKLAGNLHCHIGSEYWK